MKRIFVTIAFVAVAFYPATIFGQDVASQTVETEAGITGFDRMSTQHGYWFFEDDRRFWSLGFNVGLSLNGLPRDRFDDGDIFIENSPMVMLTPQITLAPFPRTFFRVGASIGIRRDIYGPMVRATADRWGSPDASRPMDVDGNAGLLLYPFAHVMVFLPFGSGRSRSIGGFYFGGGGGLYITEFTFVGFSIVKEIPVADFTLGFKIGGPIVYWDISYTVRSDFSSVTSVFSTGFVFRPWRD